MPGLIAPLRVGDQQWMDASFVNSFILRQILRECTADEVWTIATSAAETVFTQAPRKRYPHWRAVADRSLRLNQAHDVWLGLRAAEQLSAAAAAHRHVRAQLADRLAGSIANPILRDRVRERLTHIFDQSAFPLKRERGPIVYTITPSQLLEGSSWRFRRDEIEAALKLGYQDARAIS
jgi:hypothetical protein